MSAQSAVQLIFSRLKKIYARQSGPKKVLMEGGFHVLTATQPRPFTVFKQENCGKLTEVFKVIVVTFTVQSIMSCFNTP